MLTWYLSLYLLVGFVLGSFHYFRNKSQDIGSIAELVAIMMAWPALGWIYILAELAKAIERNPEKK